MIQMLNTVRNFLVLVFLTSVILIFANLSFHSAGAYARGGRPPPLVAPQLISNF